MTPTARRALVAAAAIAVIAAGIFILRGRSPETIRIAGRTVGPAGAPLPDVRVILEVLPGDTEGEISIERVETLSDALGNFSIDFQGHWRRASYRLKAQKPGYEKLSIDDMSLFKKSVTLRLALVRP